MQVINGIKNNFTDFINFLLEKNIFQMGISFIIATQINNLFKNLTDAIIMPISNKVISTKNTDKTTNVVGIQFKFYAFIINLFNFFIIMVFIYFLFKLSNINKGILTNIFQKIKGIF